MTTRRRTPARRLAVVPLLSAALLGCSSATPPSAAPSTAPAATVGAAASSTRAAELEAGLTAVLVERAYVVAAAAGGSPEAAAALDASSLALAEVLGAAGTESRAPLLAALRACDAAVLGLAGPACEPRLTEVVRAAVPRLESDQLAGRLSPAATAGWPALREVAGRARGTARVLAGAVAADRGLGRTATPATTLRADLTWLLVEHVALATAAAGTDDPGARAALSANGEDLAALLGRSYGEVRMPFLQAWNAHLDRFGTWTAALRAGEVVRAAMLRPSLAGLSGELGRVLAGHVTALSAARLEQELRPALTSLVQAAEAQAQGRPGAPGLRQAAVADVAAPAALVAAAVAEDRRLA